MMYCSHQIIALLSSLFVTQKTDKEEKVLPEMVVKEEGDAAEHHENQKPPSF